MTVNVTRFGVATTELDRPKVATVDAFDGDNAVAMELEDCEMDEKLEDDDVDTIGLGKEEKVWKGNILDGCEGKEILGNSEGALWLRLWVTLFIGTIMELVTTLCV